MDSFLFAVNATLPLVLVVVIGYFLKRIGLFTKDLALKTNRIVFNALLPVMLFQNIYGIDVKDGIRMGYVAYGIIAVLIVFFIALLTSPLITKESSRKASLIQSTFRSNYALIGVPLASAITPADGAGVASFLVLFTIPIFNILAVILFSAYSKNEKPSIKKTLIGILKNPLIIGVALGALFLLIRVMLAKVGVSTTIDDIPLIATTLNYLSRAATPLALLSLGAQFEFSAVGGMKRELIYGITLKIIIFPIIALSVAYLMGSFTSAEMACFVALFSTPVAVSTVPMAQELGGDVDLAGQLVVFSTIASTFTIFFSTFALRALGVF